MVAIIILVVTLVLSLTLTRVATLALVMTGMSRESARFQARSALTGVGFTTTEAESVVNHPVRRHIVMMLMLIGNLGIATVVATIIVSLISTRETDDWFRNLAVLFGSLLCIWFAARSRWLDRVMSRVITRALRKWTNLDVRDYIGLLHLANEYAVLELRVEQGDWIAGQTLEELKLPNEGVLVLGIQRPGATYLGAPTGSTQILAGDTLLVYGPIARLEEIDSRRAGRQGYRAHQAAVVEQIHRVEEESAHDPATIPEEPRPS